MNQSRVRNFCIIAHIDHGKSTLADRLLEITGAVDPDKHQEQFLDQMELERERGITIKAKAIWLQYDVGGETYELNLIDTPGHVDFSYEVSRSLAACEGALLVVDAAQGVEAQTLANLYHALDHELVIIPVINKVDLPGADVEQTIADLEAIGFGREEIILASARTGYGIDQVLTAVIGRIPPPDGNADAPLSALIFDSHYDPYKGVIAYVRIMDGVLRRGMDVLIMAAKKYVQVTDVGVLVPSAASREDLAAGDVGFVACGIKNVRDCRVGDTITGAEHQAQKPLPGYKAATPMVFSGLYPVDTGSYDHLRAALGKLQLNDAALLFEPESSAALGFGFRCGFLGLLHLDIVRERLEREYSLELITTAPNVRYQVTGKDGSQKMVDNPAEFPAPGQYELIEEPFVAATIICPGEFVGPVMELCQQRRGEMAGMEYVQQGQVQDRVVIRYDLPLGEIMFDFFDQLKSRTRGYASLDYQFLGYRPAQVVKLELLVNGEPVDALSRIVHRDEAVVRGRQLVEQLSESISRQLFEVVIQASLGSRIIARTRLAPMRKDVTGKCYGGDITRKRKLREKQQEGKRRMKMVGRVEIPQEAFLAVLRSDDSGRG